MSTCVLLSNQTNLANCQLFFDGEWYRRNIFKLETDFLVQAGLIKNKHQSKVFFTRKVNIFI